MLVLKDLAHNAKTLFYVHISAFFDCIGEALRDSNLGIVRSLFFSLCTHTSLAYTLVQGRPLYSRLPPSQRTILRALTFLPSFLAVRECGLEALRCALFLILQREHRMRHQWYHITYHEASEALVVGYQVPFPIPEYI